MKNLIPRSSESTTGIGRNIFLLKHVHRKHLSVLSLRSEQFRLRKKPSSRVIGTINITGYIKALQHHMTLLQLAACCSRSSQLLARCRVSKPARC